MVLFTHEPFASEPVNVRIGDDVKVMVKMTKLTSKSDDDIDE